MNTTFEQTETAYMIAIRDKARKTISELRDAAGAQIKDTVTNIDSNEACFLEVLKIVQAYIKLMQSLGGIF